MSSMAKILAALPEAERRAALETLSPDELAALEYTWPVWARPDQLPPPPPWRTWLNLGGRGAGKTRTTCEAVRADIEAGRRGRIAFIGPTADTLRRDIVEGPSGFLAIAPPWNRPQHEPSQRRMVWQNGAIVHLCSSEEPDRLRGLNVDGGAGDEVTSWARGSEEACWSNLQFALRIPGPKGDAPATVLSTTPKRHGLLRAIMSDPTTVTTRSRTFDNSANLDAGTLAYLKGKWGGTTLGRQELDAELLDDVDGALWSRAMIEECRVHVMPQLRRIVVAVDPAGGSGRSNDETGIIAAGVGMDGRGYVLADASGRYTPDGWARAATGLYESLKADRIVAEQNFGGAMVEATLRAVSPNVPVRMVHASRGKQVRAEPISALYEQRRVSHVSNLPGLEDQLCGWNPAENGSSPDRLDALVWALTDLMGEAAPAPTRMIRYGYLAR